MARFQKILFSYVTPIVRVGRERPLEFDDAPALPETLHPKNASDKFDEIKTDKFTKFIIGAFFATGKLSHRMLVLSALRIAVAVSTPILLKNVLEQIPNLHQYSVIPIGILLLAFALGFLGMSGAVIMQHFFSYALSGFAVIVNGMNRRVVTHALRLRHSSRSAMHTGDLVNHLSSDSDAIAEGAFFLPEFFSGALETMLVITVLFIYLGWAAVAALATLMLLSPLTVFVANRYRKLDHHIMELRDERVTLMSQILQGIRVVKFQAWESSSHAEVSDVRRREISTRVRIVLTDALSTILFISTTTLVAFAGFLAFVLLGGTLSAPIVFACLALFAMLEEPFGMVSHLLANLQHARVATRRLHKFFNVGIRPIDNRPLSPAAQSIGVRAHEVLLQYPTAPAPTLHNLSLMIDPGMSVAIIGPVGSGKSSLLRSLAGLHQLTNGTIDFVGVDSNCRPRTAYVPQEAFILNASLRDNITFGSEEETGDIVDIIADCALVTDVNQMPAGIETEIGERGVNLSGGQKQRVSLARATYHKPGIVFLDDPLSAVDVHTEELLVERLLFGRWENITRVIVTHRLTHLHRFDRIIVMDGGHIQAIGDYKEVSHLIAGGNSHFANSLHESALRNEAILDGSHITHPTSEPGLSDEVSRITEDEDRDIGAVRIEVYWHYVRAMVTTHPVLAPLIFVGLVSTAALITLLPILQTSWMGYWTDTFNTATPIVMGGIKGFWQTVVQWFNVDVANPITAIAIYGVLGTLVLTGWLFERILWLYRSAAAAQTIHDSALAGVLGAPLRFFDSTPMGRILNRFARDMEGIDDHLSWNFEQSFKSLSQTIGSLLLIVMVLPIILLVLVPVLFVYNKLQRDYRTAAREAKRLESIARSPRYAHFKEMVTGLDVIHGFAREQFFIDTFYTILSNYQRAFWCSILLNRWFSVRVPIVSGFIAVITSIGIIILAFQGNITTGMAGVVLTYALSFWWNLNWTIRAFSEVESRMTSVERLRRYGSIKPEPRTSKQPQLGAAQAWPTHGEIDVKNLCVRYADHLPLVLNNISFHVPARSKVGIIGRTGSGKSTLFQTFFRFIEPASGSILIDGVDICTIPLQRLRSSLAIIPQDPTLFIGTVRTNLDRFNHCSDNDIWTALRRVQMFDVIDRLPMRLTEHVMEGGLNFSQGQRQLLCMARAILSDARIIVLDEATASVDVETDALIQKTIREEFSDVTVLIIAHRLDTVIDADMIVELRDGRIVATTP